MITKFKDEYSWLSNFQKVKVVLDGVVYESIEYAYQAAKTLNPEVRAEIAKSKNPKLAGKLVIKRPDWLQVQLEIMEDLNRQKYNQEPFKSLLLATGDEELIEGNWWSDYFFGCVFENNEWVGENHLGKIIMKIRSELIS
jgi:ribA/ribD-fused uncharacterized protein